jgi:D-erythro-7,8-dihydroneopterin triphosphate epimerase
VGSARASRDRRRAAHHKGGPHQSLKDGGHLAGGLHLLSNIMNMEKKLTEIEIKNMRVRTILGINDWEREKEQDIVISIKFTYDAAQAIADDQVDEAINYKTITKDVLSYVGESEYFLIETLTDTLYQMITKIEGVKKTCVVVEKPHALRFCDNLIVRRSDYNE